MTLLQAGLLAVFALITCAAYQTIPTELARLGEKRGSNTVRSLVTTDAFTLFIRLCGADHLVMAGAMLLMAMSHHLHPAVGWAVVGSAGLVAGVSALTATLVWLERRQ